ncbi:MAG: class II aldolase/adducin family protein [bacterium]|nr:class II aldolase/adducin family protein [bacterium]
MSDAKRAELVTLGRNLLADHLVVRTWGNFSVRTEGETFLITPSGRRYETMTEDDLAVVENGKGTGRYKPSSEHPMHALVYGAFPEAGCVLHTHQPYASALSLEAEDIPLDAEDAEALGQDTLPLAPYGLPSTSKLHRNVEQTLEKTRAQVILLRAHGALIWANGPAEARELGNALERVAQKLYRERVGTFGEEGRPLASSERTASGARFFIGPDEVTPDEATRANHLRIYAKRPDVGTIITNLDSEVQAFFGRRLLPYLDDFAQLVGRKADSSLGSNVVLTQSAAYCLGADLETATNVELVLEKNARAARIGEFAGTAPIAAWECVLMNQIYQRKYSKQATVA